MADVEIERAMQADDFAFVNGSAEVLTDPPHAVTDVDWIAVHVRQ